MKNLLSITAAILLLSGCTKAPESEGDAGLIRLNVVVNQPATKSGNLETDNIEYYFSREAETDCITFHQAAGDNDFGRLSAAVPPGSYEITVVAHNSGQATLKGDTLLFDTVTETFHGTDGIKLELGQIPPPVRITLKRINTRIEIQATDEIPEGAHKVRLTATNLSNSLNIKYHPNKSETIVREYTLKQSSIGKKNIKFSLNAFTSEEAKDGCILTMQTFDKEGTEIQTFQSPLFDVKPNTLYIFSGPLYDLKSHPGIEIEINTEWDEIIKYPTYSEQLSQTNNFVTNCSPFYT